MAPSVHLTQGFIGEQSGLFEELKELEARARSLLTEERSKSATLLKALEGAPLKTELSLLNDNQQLALQLQQMQDKVKVCQFLNLCLPAVCNRGYVNE